MAIAAMTVDLRMEMARSLKDRRQVVRSMKETLRHGFNVSVAELDEAMTWQSATLGLVAVSGSRAYLSEQMQQMEQAVERLAAGLGAEISGCWWEFVD
jgi:uncharacterized protein YlxP (DUF503 family)